MRIPPVANSSETLIEGLSAKAVLTVPGTFPFVQPRPAGYDRPLPDEVFILGTAHVSRQTAGEGYVLCALCMICKKTAIAEKVAQHCLFLGAWIGGSIQCC